MNNFNKSLFLKVRENQVFASDPRHSCYVSASAGSGKTKVIIDRILRLMLQGCKVDSMLCITFTNNAVEEMFERLKERLRYWFESSDLNVRKDVMLLLNEGDYISDLQIQKAKNLYIVFLREQHNIKIQTLHSFCFELLCNAGIMSEVEQGAALGAAISTFSIFHDYLNHSKDTNNVSDASSVHNYDDLHNSSNFEAVGNFFSGAFSQIINSSFQGDLVKQILDEMVVDLPMEEGFILEDERELIHYFNSCRHRSLYLLLRKYDYKYLITLVSEMISTHHNFADFLKLWMQDFDLAKKDFCLSLGLQVSDLESYAFLEEGGIETLKLDFISSFDLEFYRKLFEISTKHHIEKDIVNLQNWILLSDGDRLKYFQNLYAIFLTKVGKVKMRILIKSAFLKTHSYIADCINRDAKKLEKLFNFERLKAYLDLNYAFFYITSHVYEKFVKYKLQMNYFEYDDIVRGALEILNQNDKINAATYSIASNIKHILIDEAQDISPIQWRVINTVAEIVYDCDNGYGGFEDVTQLPNIQKLPNVQTEVEKQEGGQDNRCRKQYHEIQGHNSLFVVGDLKQSIYGFQGANPALFAAIEDFYRNKLQEIAEKFHRVEFNLCFRCSIKVMHFVNKFLKIYEMQSNAIEAISLSDEEGVVALWKIQPFSNEFVERYSYELVKEGGQKVFSEQHLGEGFDQNSKKKDAVKEMKRNSKVNKKQSFYHIDDLKWCNYFKERFEYFKLCSLENNVQLHSAHYNYDLNKKIANEIEIEIDNEMNESQIDSERGQKSQKKNENQKRLTRIPKNEDEHFALQIVERLCDLLDQIQIKDDHMIKEETVAAFKQKQKQDGGRGECEGELRSEQMQEAKYFKEKEQDYNQRSAQNIDNEQCGDFRESETQQLKEASKRKKRTVMILFRKRCKIQEYLLKYLAQLQINFCDYMTNSSEENIILNDLIAVVNFVCNPYDEMNLAILLKSPLFNVSEKTLFDLAYNRQSPLWDLMRDEAQMKERQLDMSDVVNLLEFFINIYSCGCTIKYFYHRILQDTDFLIQQRFELIYNVEEVRAVIKILYEFIDEFEVSYDAYDFSEFVKWFYDACFLQAKSFQNENLSHSENFSIKIMTVHSAKGLEADYVILADAFQKHGFANQVRDSILWYDEKPYLGVPPSFAFNDSALYRSNEERGRSCYVDGENSSDGDSNGDSDGDGDGGGNGSSNNGDGSSENCVRHISLGEKISALYKKNMLDENLRLFYVAITRARVGLYIVGLENEGDFGGDFIGDNDLNKGKAKLVQGQLVKDAQFIQDQCQNKSKNRGENEHESESEDGDGGQSIYQRRQGCGSWFDIADLILNERG